MRRLAQFVLGGFPTSPAATRALQATMADWRHESEAASSKAGRARAALLGAASVARVLAAVGLKELPTAWKAPFLWRTAGALFLLVAALVTFDSPARFADVLTGSELAVLATAKAVQAVFLVLPLVAFISEATGRRSRQAPSAGVFTMMAIAIALMVSVLPEVTTFQAQLSWTHFANAATPPPLPLPSAYRLVVGGPVLPTTLNSWIYFGTTFAILASATVALTALAYQVRQRRGLRAWLLGVSPFLAVPGSLYGMMLLTGLLVAFWRDAALWLWPIRGLVVVASVTVLPLILAARLAQEIAVTVTTDSEVTS